MANLIRGLSENGGVVFCGVDSTDIVRKAEKLHTTSATCSAALGRLLTGAALMGSMLKDDRDRITLRVAGGGPAGGAAPAPTELPLLFQSSFFNRYPILYTVSILSIQPSFLRRRAMWVSTVRRLSVSGMPPQTRSYITSR